MDIIKISKENLLLSLPEFKYDNTWIAGGAIRDAVLKEKISDIDIFGVSKDKLDLFIETNLKGCKKVYDSTVITYRFNIVSIALTIHFVSSHLMVKTYSVTRSHSLIFSERK
jgi:tRNA nucleotidyltransferase/poly(A) polymerase